MQNDFKFHIIGIAAGEFEFEGRFYTRFVKSSSIFKFINEMVKKLEIIYRQGGSTSDSIISSGGTSDNIISSGGTSDNIISGGIDNSQKNYPVSAVQSFADVLYQHGKLQQCENLNNKYESIISVIIIINSFHYPYVPTFHVNNILLEMQAQTFFKCNSITIESALCL